jgi:DNA N-6-adenine-methyltransferase (Dam)
MDGNITLYDNAHRALTQLVSIDEVKAYLDTSAAIQEYARRANNKDMEIKACRYRLWCERRAGELLAQTVRPGGDRQSEKALSIADDNGRLPQGITRDQSSQWQRLADIPEAEFEERIERIISPVSAKKLLMSDAQSESVEWYTPEKYIASARVVLGDIDLDPASCESANKVVRAGTYFTIDQDGLKADWFGRVWLNPPYGKACSAFAAKLCEAYDKEEIESAILLVNSNSTDTACLPRCGIRCSVSRIIE